MQNKFRGVMQSPAAARFMGRDCGDPRAPLLPLDTAATEKIETAVAALPLIAAEPRGW